MRLVGAAAALCAFGGGFALARLTPGTDAHSVPASAPAGMPTQFGEPQADAGSVFRARFASADPIEGKEGLLLTPRREDDECRDNCPMTVRVHGGERGWRESLAVLGSLKSNLRSLQVAARGQVPEFAAAMDRFLAAYALAASRRGTGSEVPRLLFMAAPRPEFGPHQSGVSLAAYTHADPHFDADFAAHPTRGMRLSISRVDERRDAERERFTLTAGDISIADVGTPSSDPGVDGPGAKILIVRGPQTGHFRGASGRCVGLLVNRDGSIEAYGPDLVPRRLDASPALRRAVLAILERP
jgi:hypothetical protein